MKTLTIDDDRRMDMYSTHIRIYKKFDWLVIPCPAKNKVEKFKIEKAGNF